MPENHIEKLTLQAANAGLPEALTSMAVLKCGEDAVFKCGKSLACVCEKPDESYYYIRQAALLGDPKIINFFGSWLQHGNLGEVDIPRALACYKLGASHGYDLATANYQSLLKSSGTTDEEVDSGDCLKDSNTAH